MSVESLEEWRKKRKTASTSGSQSKQNTKSDELGPTLTDEEQAVANNVMLVLRMAHIKPFTTKSDFARLAANEIAVCASDGLISTRLNDAEVSNRWIITKIGLDVLEELEHAFTPRH